MVVQEVTPPFDAAGGHPTPLTLGSYLQLHLPRLFPPSPPSYSGSRCGGAENVYEVAFPIVQGVVPPPETEMAWLGACMVGADGWVSVCVGLK